MAHALQNNSTRRRLVFPTLDFPLVAVTGFGDKFVHEPLKMAWPSAALASFEEVPKIETVALTHTQKEKNLCHSQPRKI